MTKYDGGVLCSSEMHFCLRLFYGPRSTHSLTAATPPNPTSHHFQLVLASSQPALIRGLVNTYTAVDMVVGIDVDKEDFDKYAVKSEIEELLRHFNKMPDFSQAMGLVASGGILADFLPAVLDNMLFSLDAGFEALREVCGID